MIEFDFSTRLVDFGDVQFNEYGLGEFMVINKGKIPFEFKIILSELSRSNLLEIYPPIGRLGAYEQQKVTMKL